MKSVSVIIPTYNGLSLLQKHLPAVLDMLRAGDELLIVDDAGHDETLNWLMEQFALVTQPTDEGYELKTGQLTKGSGKVAMSVIVNWTNLRFGATVNRAVQLAKHDQIFLLNNDVSPEPDVLEQLKKYMDDAAVFAVGCLEVEQDDASKKSGKNKLWFERGMFMHSRADNFKPGPTAWASGGSALFDKKKWLQLKGFDPAYYPAYWEDVDLSFRARKKGWKVLFEPAAVVHHHHESTNATVWQKRQIERMSWHHAQTFVWKNGTFWQKIANILWQPYWWWKRINS